MGDQSADADARDVRPRLQGHRQRPAGKRCVLLDVPRYEAVLQNEGRLVVETPAGESFKPGDEGLAIPTHVCPTVAMHQRAYVVENGRPTGAWNIVGCDRVLSV
jgi:D-serine deaminase-like pyridoxal phosphate-dependent protein